MRRLFGALWLAAALAVILAAVLTVVARQMLPMVPGYRMQIEAVASHWLHHPVRIGGIAVGWHWFTPTVTLDNVRVMGPSDQVALNLGQVGLRLGIWNSLISRQLVPGEIDLRGVRVVLDRSQAGRWSLRGLALPVPAAGGGGNGGGMPGWLTRITYHVSDASLVVQGLPAGGHYRFRNVTLSARPVDDGIAVFGGFAPPGRVGRQINFAVELHRAGSAVSGNWEARAYLDLQAIQLSGLPLRQWLPRMPVLHGQINARIWSVWANGRPTRVSGHLAVQGLSLGAAMSSHNAGSGLTDFSGDLRWQATSGGWRLQGADIHASAGSDAWPTDAFDVALSDRNGQRTFSAWAGFLRLQNLTPLLLQLPWVPDAWTDRVAALAPAGELSDLRLHAALPATASPSYALSAGLRDLSLNARDRQPGVAGLSGTLALTNTAGSLVLDSPHLSFDAPAVFAGPLPRMALHGAVYWRRETQGDEVIAPGFTLQNPDLALRGQLGLWLPVGGKPEINLMAHVQRAKVMATSSYLPVKLLHPDLVKWFVNALQGGEVTGGSLLLRGDPTQFPFRNHAGVFELHLDIHDGMLAYFSDWPRLKEMQGTLDLHDLGLKAHITQGTMLTTHLSDVDVDIPDLDNAVLSISGSGDGSLGDVEKFLSYTPLAHGRKALFAQMRSGGHTRFELKLSLPLRVKEMYRWQLQGQAHVTQGTFALTREGFALSAIDGDLAFTQRSLSAHDIKASFRGSPVVLGASTRSDGLATLTLDGHLSVAQLLGPGSVIARYAHGDSDWRAALALPMTSASYRRYGTGLTLVSGLKGVAISLPAPLGKSAGTSKGLVVQLSLTRADEPVFLRYGPDFQGLLQLAGKTGCRHVVRGDLRFAAGAPALPASGVDIEGRLAYFDVDTWRRVLDAMPGSGVDAQCPAGRGLMPQTVNRLHMHFGILDIFGRRLHEVRLDAKRTGKQWAATVAAKEISGKLSVPVALHGGTPLRFDLTQLDLDGATQTSSGSSSEPDPASLPALSGHIGALLVTGRRLRNVSLRTTPTRDGMQIHLAEVDEPHLRARASGSWLREPGGHTLMQIQLEVDSDDAGKALDALNVQAGLAGGQGHLSANLSWPGGPGQLAWGVLDGQARLTLKNGRLEQVNPGQTGRLLGLLNLAALPQRLSLNFGDVFDKGFAFDDMTSRFQIRDGNIYTQDTHISGPAANMSITGRVGMVARDYDAQVSIVPQVQSTVAIAGAVLGGPVTGAALFLLDRLLGIGKQINKAAEFRYHVTGPWDAPKVQAEGDDHPAKPPSERKTPQINPF
ncbi:TIGR02099 family protein [Acidihalobacter aeolianus]|uniref:TIGR02099 family protein n=1 Tax=Acidihalobacter aeolianus TaxID=2792603 RepID=A0A1D8K9A9_9GAMM|nr:TIGR02099 family protein [Acidihalobacter aeolianus]